MGKRDEGGCESKVFDGRNASKRDDEKHYGCSSRISSLQSRKKISKIKKWRREYISYFTNMGGNSRNVGKKQGEGLMADERERERVMELLSKFRAICKNLSQENKTQRERKVSESSALMRIDILAAREVKKMSSLYTKRTNSPGPIPGVEVGDKFRYRMELILVGLHSNLQKGIDFVFSNGAGGERIATSVVASGGYANETSDPNVLIYCGQGGEHEDQSLNNPGNSALKNSIRVKNPVRVIRGTKERASSYATTFVYDGLYRVVAFWSDISCSGKLLYKFKLVRITGS
nr:histone-lysine N-methyltransferase, H3 lysine-9 specific SUVH6-like [Ipomoea batatas]